MRTPPTLRLAKPEESQFLVELSEQTFRDTYGGYRESENMDAYVGSSFNRRQIQRELVDPAIIYLLALIDQRPVGYAKLQDHPPPPCVIGEGPVELARIYVTTDLIGHGFGSALMRACLDQAQGNGYHTIWLSVLETNSHAIDFYERWYFKNVGSRDFQLGNMSQIDAVMMRKV